MSENDSKQQTQKIVVVVLLLAVVTMAYLRFFRGPSDAPAPMTAANEQSALEISSIREEIEAAASASLVSRAPYQAPTRDIFAPVGQVQGLAPVMKSLPVLTGIIRGANESLAVIDGDVVGAGDRIGAYLILEVRTHDVVLLRGNKQIILNKTIVNSTGPGGR